MQDTRLVVTLTVADFRDMLREAAKEGAREALSSLPSSRLSKTQVAHALRKSVSTIDRYVADGMPYDGDVFWYGTARSRRLPTPRRGS